MFFYIFSIECTKLCEVQPLAERRAERHDNIRAKAKNAALEKRDRSKFKNVTSKVSGCDWCGRGTNWFTDCFLGYLCYGILSVVSLKFITCFYFFRT